MVFFKKWWWKWRYKNAIEYLQLKIAFAAPRWLVYWCGIRLWANVVGTPAPDIKLPDALDYWEGRRK